MIRRRLLPSFVALLTVAGLAACSADSPSAPGSADADAGADAAARYVPGHPMAGRERSGAVAARSEELRTTLRDNGIEPVGETTAWFYDPPWTLPFRRRNEVVVTI